MTDTTTTDRVRRTDGRHGRGHRGREHGSEAATATAAQRPLAGARDRLLTSAVRIRQVRPVTLRERERERAVSLLLSSSLLVVSLTTLAGLSVLPLLSSAPRPARASCSWSGGRWFFLPNPGLAAQSAPTWPRLSCSLARSLTATHAVEARV